MKNRMRVVQCWDDGVETDIQLVDIFRRYGAKATFNLNAGLHNTKRTLQMVYKGTEISKLSWGEMKSVYDGFTIANHSLTHPRLESIPIEEARRDIWEGRERLQQFFAQPILGFAYPYGTYSGQVMVAVQEAGHLYARTVKNVEAPFPPQNPMAFHPSCHFLASDFWRRYENAKESGVFYFWGHSYELVSGEMWTEFEQVIKRISTDPESTWGEVSDLFQAESSTGQ